MFRDKEDINVYQKHLRRLGTLLTVLSVLVLIMLGAARVWGRDIFGAENLIWRSAESLVSLVVGLLALDQSRRGQHSLAVLILVSVLFVAEGILLIADGYGEIDALIDLSLLLIGLCQYLLQLSFGRSRKWKWIQQAKPVTLDLRISGKNDLFDPLFMAPHLEINRNIPEAVDRFLEIKGAAAPLILHIHSTEPLSESLKEIATESIRERYADEAKRVERFLELRFARAIALILISVVMLSVIKVANSGDSKGTVWTIVSNYAAFSLWQVGSTYFERSDAARKMMQYQIARNAEIAFL